MNSFATVTALYGVYRTAVPKVQERLPDLQMPHVVDDGVISNPVSTHESVVNKLNDYLLNPYHPKGGPKANWFEQALGFTRENLYELASQIVFDKNSAWRTVATDYGIKYNQIIPITGTNGKTIEILFVWIENNDGVVRLVTGIPAKK